jgi:hypothetical protein
MILESITLYTIQFSFLINNLINKYNMVIKINFLSNLIIRSLKYNSINHYVCVIILLLL